MHEHWLPANRHSLVSLLLKMYVIIVTLLRKCCRGTLHSHTVDVNRYVNVMLMSCLFGEAQMI